MIQYLFLFIFLFGIFTSRAQNKFILQFSADSCEKKQGYLFKYHDGNSLIDAKVSVKNNIYTITGAYLGKHTFVEVQEQIDSSTYSAKRFLIDKSHAEIRYLNCDTTKSNFIRKKYNLNNASDFTPFWDKVYLYTQKENKEINELISLFQQVLAKNTISDSLNTIGRKIELAQQDLFNKQIDYIKLHLDQYLSFIFFRDLIDQKITVESDTIQKVFDLFSDELKSSYEGKIVAENIKKKRLRFLNEPKEGKLAFDFRSVDINGKNVTLNKLRGKYVLLVFWATWCRPCIQEVPYLQKIRKKYNPSQLEIISISQDDEKVKLVTYLTKNKMNWTHIFGDQSIFEDYFINEIPETVLIDPKGIIIYFSVGSNNIIALEKKLKEILY